MELQKKVKPTEIIRTTSLAKKLEKSFYKAVCLGFLSCFYLNVFGQNLILNTQNGILPNPAENDSSYVAQSLAPDLQSTSFESIAPTFINTVSNVNIEDIAKYGVLLQLEDDYIKQLLDNQPDKLRLRIPVNLSNYFDLQLSKIDITTDDFKVTTSSGSTIQKDENAELFYWGIVKDDPSSIAAVSFYNDEVRCVISDKDGNYVLGAYEDAHVLFAEEDLNQPHDFSCEVVDEFLVDDPTENNNSIIGVDSEEFINVEPIEINVECDYEMYLTFNSNIEKVKDHVTALFNESAILFANENIKIKLGEIFVWDTEDPFINMDSLYKVLYAFGEYRAGEYPGKVGLFLSDKDRPGNGWAHTGGLCSTRYSFAAIKITDPTKVVPVSTYSYDVFTFTHELGHIFGSNHTQDCVWGSYKNQALDNCYEPNGNCVPGPTPIDGGTIMSYCTTNANIGINFEKGFGEEPGNRIRAYINSSNCVDPELCTIPYNEQVFLDYPWLNDAIEQTNCDYTEIYEYENSWIYVKTLSNNSIYLNGSSFCTDHANLDCFGYYNNLGYLQTLQTSSCGCSETPNPPQQPCNPELTCNTDPCEEGGVQELNEDCECVIIEETVSGCTNPSDTNYNSNANCHDETECEGTGEEPNPSCSDDQIFTKFPWLSDFVNTNNCEGTIIKEYKLPSYSFIQIEDLNSKNLYFQNGTYYCTDSPNYSCLEQYGLDEIGYCWSCGGDGGGNDTYGCIDVMACNYDSTANIDDGSCVYRSGCMDTNACNFDSNACNDDGSCTYSDSYTGIVFREFCDGGQNYYLIYLLDGIVLDPYNADGVNYNYPKGATVEFGFVEEDSTPCFVADKAVTIECIREIDCEYSISGEVIFEECDNGVVYYLIKLPDGSIIDPYNAEGVDFIYREGAMVEFSFMPSSITPCYKAEKAVEIICIRETSPTPTPTDDCDLNDEIFTSYSFLNDLIDSNNCNGISIKESGQFIIIEDAGGRSLYYNGTFYCDWESCIEFYLPDGAQCVWNCQSIQPKLQNSLGMQLKSTPEAIVEIFPNPNKGKFSLKINNGLENSSQTKVELYSLEGKLLKTLNYSDHFTTLDISEFGKGIYLLSITNNNYQKVEKLIVN